MDHTIKINNQKRKSLYLSILEYAIADVIASFKRPATYEEIAEESDEFIGSLGEVIEVLIKEELVTAGKRSGKLEVTKKWKEATKVDKVTKEVNPLIHKMHQAIIDPDRVVPRTDYQWSSQESKWADELSTKLKNSYRINMGREGTDEEIMTSFCMIIDNLTDYWNNGFSVLRLNTFYNDVVSTAKAKIKSERSQGKIMDNASAIREASSTFVPDRFR